MLRGVHPDEDLLPIMCPAPGVVPQASDGSLLVGNAEHYAFHNPHHDYYGAWHYEWIGITDLITFQLGKGGQFPALYRCPLWVFLNRHKISYGDYITGKYPIVTSVFPNDYTIVCDDKLSPHAQALEALHDTPAWVRREAEKNVVQVRKYIEGEEFDANEFIKEILG